MFDLDVSKMIIVGIVALAVIPPKDLPRVMRTVGQTIGRMRRMASEFQGQFMEAMREVEREADLDSVKKEFQAISDQAKIDTNFDPVGMVRDDMTKAVADLRLAQLRPSHPDRPPTPARSRCIRNWPDRNRQVGNLSHRAGARFSGRLRDEEAEPEASVAPRSAAE